MKMLILFRYKSCKKQQNTGEYAFFFAFFSFISKKSVLLQLASVSVCTLILIQVL